MAEKKTNLLSDEAKERARKTFGVDKVMSDKIKNKKAKEEMKNLPKEYKVNRKLKGTDYTTFDKLSPKQKEKMQVMYKSERAPGSEGYKPTKTDTGPNYKTKNASASSNKFGDAFAAARKGGQKEFTWNGKKYNTNLASDKKSESKVDYQDSKPNQSNAPSPFRSKKVEEAAPTKKEMTMMEKAKDIIGVGREATEKEKMGRSLQDAARRSMGMKKGGSVKRNMRDGCAVRGKTKGKLF